MNEPCLLKLEKETLEKETLKFEGNFIEKG